MIVKLLLYVLILYTAVAISLPAQALSKPLAKIVRFERFFSLNFGGLDSTSHESVGALNGAREMNESYP